MKSYLILLVSFGTLFTQCSPENKMTHYYRKNKKTIQTIDSLSEVLKSKHSFEKISLRFSDPIGMTVFFGNAFNNVTCNFSPIDLKILDQLPCDSCTSEEKIRYERILSDTTLKEILRLYVQLKPNAIRISTEGIFLAIRGPIKRKNSMLESGIFISHKEGFNKNPVIKEIDIGTYIYEDVIE